MKIDKRWGHTALFILFGVPALIVSFIAQYMIAGWHLGAYWFNPNSYIRQYRIHPVWWPGKAGDKS